MNASELKSYVCGRIAAATPAEAPFPHLVVDDLLPDSILADVHRFWPEDAQSKTLGQLGRLTGGDYPARKVVPFKNLETTLDAERLGFWSMLRELTFSNPFNGALLERLKAPMAARKARGGLTSKVYAPDTLIVEDHEGYAISPHTDSPKRLITVLIYLPTDAVSMRPYGTSLYRLKQGLKVDQFASHYPFDMFDRVVTVDFIPNRLIAFIRDDNTFHGVETVVAPPQPRRLIIHQMEAVPEAALAQAQA